MKGKLYGSLWLLIYFMKWPLAVGIPLLYQMTSYEPTLVMNSIWFFAFTAIVWDVVRWFDHLHSEH